MNKVTPELLSDIVKRLVDALAPERIYLFGSYAWGTPDEGSDIDLLVVVDDDTPPVLTQATSAYLAFRGIGIATEVIVQRCFDFNRFSVVRSSLSYKIAQEGVLIYDRRHQTRVGPVVALESQQ